MSRAAAAPEVLSPGEIEARVMSSFPEIGKERARKAVFALAAIMKNPDGSLYEAPELYIERREKRECIVDFLNRVYAPWLDGSFSRADLRHLDKKAYVALINYEHKRNTSVPLERLNLPTQWQKNHFTAKHDKETMEKPAASVD